ncbi:MAG: indolepyruvate ferredoxin oxidoreductase family protein [Ilumatobacteraceae bacterium]
MSESGYVLADRYTRERTTAFMSGVQALCRLPVEQLMADRAQGLDTAAFASGYPGSPLGGYGDELDRVLRLRSDLPVRHVPAVNEEHAATAVMGSQLVTTRPDALHPGVLGLWYGKAPGLERAGDAIRHATFAGTAAHGGAVALVGDDPAAKSSTIPSSSVDMLAALRIPVLVPSDPAEVLDLGRHAIAMSRAAGLWTSLRLVADVADGTASIDLDVDRVRPVMPERPSTLLAPTGRLTTPFTLELERELIEVRLPLALDYIAANSLNRFSVDAPDAKVGIVASGTAHRMVHEALGRLGLASADAIGAAGIRILEMVVPYPIDSAEIRRFADGLDDMIVVEEKQPVIETTVRSILFGVTGAPRLHGKSREAGDALLPTYGVLDAVVVAEALRSRLADRLGARLAPPPPPTPERIPLTVERSPFFCSGCPHNTSTVVPEGTVVGAGIGCHTMVMLGEPGRGGDILGVTAMGNEGAQWIGMESFVATDHIVQNLGDGTYFHSGQLAITSAISAGSHVTYKILHNGAVSMTGGQTPSGQISPTDLAGNLLRQGVTRVIVTTDDPHRYRDWPSGVDVWDRSRVIEAQEVLAATPGVTVLIHDQPCAAELRRARKRDLAPTPTERISIDERICEGCGDCGRKSNCLSVQPVDTPFGRRTRIDQTSCNLDRSCIEGDCPSFIAVETDPTPLQRLAAALFDRAPSRGDNRPSSAPTGEPPAPTPLFESDELALRMTGIGGTGVVTVAQIVGTAAMLDGWTVQGLDQIGLSQKAGPVVSDLRFTRNGSTRSNRLGPGDADVLIALDQLTAAGERGLGVVDGRTVVIGSDSRVPTGSMIPHPELVAPDADALDARIASAAGDGTRLWADAAGIASVHLGDTTSANVVVIGMALQAGALPISPGSVAEAIRVNGAAVETNLEALRLGRLAAAGMLTASKPADEIVDTPDSIIERLAIDLDGWGGRRVGDRFRDEVAGVAAIDPDPDRRLALTVARGLHRLVAYKDEYEVARLIVEGGGDHQSRSISDGPTVRYRLLHPPVLAAMGVQRKLRFGPAWMPMFRVLRRARVLRGTPFDIFGFAAIRRDERRLPDEYRSLVAAVTDAIGTVSYERLVEIADLPDVVRGYETLKESRIEVFRTRAAAALSELRP